MESVAYEWTSGNLFWLDAGNIEIGVINVTGGHRKVLIKANLQKPRSLALHPKAGYIFINTFTILLSSQIIVTEKFVTNILFCFYFQII